MILIVGTSKMLAQAGEAGHVFESVFLNQFLGIKGSTQIATNYGWKL